MTPEQQAQVEAVYYQVLAAGLAERGAALARACAGQPEVRREVEALLEVQDLNDFLQTPVFRAGLGALAGDASLRSTEIGPPAQFSDEWAGQTLGGRFYVEAKLDSGGICDVYLARDKPELMSRPVVVKVLQEKSLQSEWLVTKFRQEVEVLTRLAEVQGAVGILDAGALPDGKPYLVMQFVSGTPLRDVMQPERGMELADVAAILSQAGRTLTAAHEKGVIHRDLKPENIMVARQPNGEWQATVIDFGIAKVKDSLVAASTSTHKVAGTIGYMSPEHLHGRPITATSDVYALGLMAYEMVTGRRPFNPETGFQLAEMQKAGVRVNPCDLRPGLPPAAQEVILKALSYAPSARYQTAREFCDKLAQALHSDTVEEIATLPAPPLARQETVPTVPARPPSPPRRWRALAAVAALAVLLLAGGLAVWRFSATAEPERSLTFWLTIQDCGATFDSTGREIFATGSGFTLNLQPPENGAFYLISEGLDERQATEWNVLWPTPKNNGGQPQLTAQQVYKTRNYKFAGSTGNEKLWLVWSAQPVPLLDSLFREAFEQEGVIRRADDLAGFLRQHGNPAPQLNRDDNRSRVTLTGRGQILVAPLELSHKRSQARPC
jgi:serine/threonine protein kinase